MPVPGKMVTPIGGTSSISSLRLALGVDDGDDAQALDQAAKRDRGRQVLDRDAGFHPPDVGLAQDQLVEGDVAPNRLNLIRPELDVRWPKRAMQKNRWQGGLGETLV
jgi:hypothetical protein